MLLVFYLDSGGPSAPIYVDHVISFLFGRRWYKKGDNSNIKREITPI
jgi:hypothetical protein